MIAVVVTNWFGVAWLATAVGVGPVVGCVYLWRSERCSSMPGEQLVDMREKPVHVPVLEDQAPQDVQVRRTPLATPEAGHELHALALVHARTVRR